jgi:hypothetical protein
MQHCLSPWINYAANEILIRGHINTLNLHFNHQQIAYYRMPDRIRSGKESKNRCPILENGSTTIQPSAISRFLRGKVVDIIRSFPNRSRNRSRYCERSDDDDTCFDESQCLRFPGVSNYLAYPNHSVLKCVLLFTRRRDLSHDSAGVRL